MRANLPILLLKAGTPAGCRWITINGGDGNGQHVLIKEKGGEVVGGASGALNGKKVGEHDEGKQPAGWGPNSPNLKHGDHVGFKNGEHASHGKVIASGRDGALIEDGKGGMHNILHKHITHKWHAGEGADAQIAPTHGPHDASQASGKPENGNGESSGASGKSLRPGKARKLKSGALARESEIVDGDGNAVGFTDTEETTDAVTMRTVKVEEEHAGKGHGLAAYRDTIDYALSQGKAFQSDKEVSASARKVYDRLKSLGYQVEQSPNVTTDDYGRLHSKDKGPVFTVTGKALAKSNIEAPRLLVLRSRAR